MSCLSRLYGALPSRCLATPGGVAEDGGLSRRLRCRGVPLGRGLRSGEIDGRTLCASLVPEAKDERRRRQGGEGDGVSARELGDRRQRRVPPLLGEQGGAGEPGGVPPPLRELGEAGMRANGGRRGLWSLCTVLCLGERGREGRERRERSMEPAGVRRWRSTRGHRAGPRGIDGAENNERKMRKRGSGKMGFF